MINASEIKPGMILDLDGELVKVVDTSFNKTAQRQAMVNFTSRNLRTGAVTNRRMTSNDKVDSIKLDTQEVQFLYRDGDNFNFMNNETYEQPILEVKQIGNAINYIKEGDTIMLLSYNGEPIDINIPTAVTLTVAQADPGFKGDTATGGTKPVVMETGLRVNAPLFINPGDKIKIDTRTGEYLQRV